MKVVLFCGGLGTRLRDYSERIPKPMVPLGYRPILWHVMKYYANFGHREFILCLGHKATMIKQYFLEYSEAYSNDVVLRRGGQEVQLLNRDISDWTIHLMDTGIKANIGERLWAARDLVKGEEMFLANYSDGLTDCRLDDVVDSLKRHPRAVAAFLAVKPPGSYHLASLGDGGQVSDIRPISRMDRWINGGYFVLRPEIFDYMEPGEELVVEPFQRLIRDGRLIAHPYEGFWAPMDTFKDKQFLDDLCESGDAPWEVWKKPGGENGPPPTLT